MKSLRILVLVHEDLKPPDSLEGYSDKEIIEWKTEYDVVSTLKDIGHDVYTLGVYDDLGVIRKALLEFKPHIAFNLLEEFHGNSLYDYHIASYMELMQQPYTGCNPRGLMLAHDKALSKQILNYHRIRTPKFSVIPLGRTAKIPNKMNFPFIVKSMVEEGSYGLAQASVVDNEEKFKERINYLQNDLKTSIIVEEYIEGRELYLSIIGNARLQTLPIVELHFGNLSEDVHHFATSKVKWDWDYQKQYNIKVIVPKDVSRDLVTKISNVGKRIYRALSLSGYARIDLRLTPDAKIYVLEANANPDIGYGEELSIAAEQLNIDYEKLLHRVITLGLKYQPETRGQ